MIGAGNIENNKNIIKIYNLLGELSYPLYITHYPLIYCNMTWNFFHSNDKLFNKIDVSFGISLIIIFNDYASYKLFDEPLRKWLTNKYLIKKKNQ